MNIPPPFDYRCPDCVWRLDVLHDDTCPWLKRHEDLLPGARHEP